MDVLAILGVVGLLVVIVSALCTIAGKNEDWDNWMNEHYDEW